VLFDLVVGACSIYGGSWIEGAGAVHAENEALRWLSDLAGLPAEAGGVFVPGGTVGNLSAMVAARGQALERVVGGHLTGDFPLPVGKRDRFKWRLCRAPAQHGGHAYCEHGRVDAA
jgi:glutamate/tyrosine decarboxylase-like PLP-dependent enzyme